MANLEDHDGRAWTAVAYLSAVLAVLHLAAMIRAADADTNILGMPYYLWYLVLTLLWVVAAILVWRRAAGVAIVAIAVLTSFFWTYSSGTSSLVLILSAAVAVLVAFAGGPGLPSDWSERIRRFSRPG